MRIQLRKFCSIQQNQDIIKNYRQAGNINQRIGLIIKSSINAYRYPDQGQHISDLGDLTSIHSIRNIYFKMKNNQVGCIILKEKPRLKYPQFKFEDLKGLSKESFGYQYYDWMQQRGFNPNERPLVKYIPDYWMATVMQNLPQFLDYQVANRAKIKYIQELAYVYQRYKEIHDFFHILLNIGTSVSDEILLKWFEMIQLGLPSCALASFIGSFQIPVSEYCEFYGEKLPKMIDNANKCEFLMNVYFEKELETNINELRAKLKIIPFKQKLN